MSSDGNAATHVGPSSVAVLVPVLNRPDRVEPLVASLDAAYPADFDPAPPRLLFLCNLGDLAQINAVVSAGEHPHIVQWHPGRADWARKINWGFRRAAHMGFEWMLLGADDLAFRPGWVEAALAVHEASAACVIGTNDLGNATVMAGKHSTHPLIHRDYLACGTIDEPDGIPPKVVAEVYDHNFVDTELVETAKARGTFAFAADSHVEHLHPFWGKGEDDATYVKGREHFHADRRLFTERRKLWAGS